MKPWNDRADTSPSFLKRDSSSNIVIRCPNYTPYGYLWYKSFSYCRCSTATTAAVSDRLRRARREGDGAESSVHMIKRHWMEGCCRERNSLRGWMSGLDCLNWQSSVWTSIAALVRRDSLSVHIVGGEALQWPLACQGSNCLNNARRSI